MRICEAIKRMIESPVNSAYDINHMLMVHAFASSIGKLEGLDEHKQYVLELAAVLHDISCPYLREKYGSAAGDRQELESEKYLEDFFSNTDVDDETVNRVIFLVTHHHTYDGIEDPDYQILVEADFLVVAQEKKLIEEIIRNTKDQIFKTETGKKFLMNILLRGAI